MVPERAATREAPSGASRIVERLVSATEGPRGTALVAVLALLSTAWWLLLGREVTFRGDDMDFLLQRRGWTADAFLAPHVGHLTVLQVAYERLMWAFVGLDPGWPYLLANCLIWDAAVLGAFVLVRRRAGGATALGCAALLLVLNANAEDLLWPFQFGNLLSIALGVGCLLALGRRDLRGDVLCAVALAGSVGASSYGLVFLLGVAVEIALSRRLRRLWLVAVVAVPYAAWRIAYHPSTGVPAATPRQAAKFALDYVSWTASTFGLLPLAWGRVLTLAAVLGLAALIVRRRGRFTGREVALVVIPVALVGLTAYARGALGAPQSGRYLQPLALLVVLAAASLLPRWRPTATTTVVALLVVLGAGAANVRAARASGDQLRGTGATERLRLGILELARPSVPPDATLEPASAYGSAFRAALWFDVVDQYGSSPGWSEAELRRAPEPTRQFADSTMASTVGLRFRSPTGIPGASPLRTTTPGAQRADGCIVAAPGSTEVELPASGVLVTPRASSEVTLRVRRWARSASPTPTSQTSRAAEVVPPEDAATAPWWVTFDHAQPLRVCSRVPGRG